VTRVFKPLSGGDRIIGVVGFVARNAWDLRTTIEEWPKIRFKETREQN
jgi:hypothetical protein